MNVRQYARTVFAIVAVLALLAGGAGVSTAAQGSGSLTVLDWAGFDAEELLDRLQERQSRRRR